LSISKTRITDLPLINISIPGYKFLHNTVIPHLKWVALVFIFAKIDFLHDYKLDITGVEKL